MAPENQPDEPNALLMQMARQTQAFMPLFQRAEAAKASNDFDAAGAAYDQLIAVSQEHLATALRFNEIVAAASPLKPTEIEPIVRPLLNALRVQADIRQAQGRLPEAERLRAEALELGRAHLDESSQVESERSHASSLIVQGRFNEALASLGAARDLFVRQGDAIMQARVTIDMVDILQWLGDGERAAAELQRAADLVAPRLAGGAPTDADVGMAILRAFGQIATGKGDGRAAEEVAQLQRIATELDYFQGLVAKLSGRWDEAERRFRAALPAAQRLGSGPALDFQLASVLVRRGNWRAGLTALEQLEPFFTASGLLRPRLAALLSLEAEALLGFGRADEALRRLATAEADLETYHDPDLLWKVQWLQGRAMAASGQAASALAAHRRAAATVDGLRRAPLGHRLDSTYLRDKLPLFREAIALAHDLGAADECCRLMEMIKSRLLTCALSSPPRPVDAETAGSLTALGHQVDDITRTLDALEYGGYQDGWTPERRSQRAALLAERATLLERIRYSDPRWRSLTEPPPFDLERVKALARETGQAYLSLFFLPPRVIAVLIDSAGSSVAATTLAPVTAERLADYHANLQADRPKPAWFDLSAGLGVEASALLPADLLERALAARQLIVAPHGPLHLICWAGLRHQGQRLFERCPVGVLPNLSCLLTLSADFSNRPGVALIGAPDYGALPSLASLPFAEAEIDAIEAAYRDAGRLIGAPLTGARATEASFWELARHPTARGGILHLACHGTFEPAEPMNSGLLLTDAKVDAAEIARAALAYDEAILSACRTGHRPARVGEVELGGDDILGLPAAFLEAGVRSVLVSIPPAADAAAFDLMVRYHDARLDGQTPLAALQEAQAAMLENGVYEPHAWVGFTVYGCQ